MSENERDDLQIEIESFGPGPEAIDEVSGAVLDHPSVREQLGEARRRLLSVRLLEPAVEEKPEEPMPPDRYLATIYDNTNNRVVLAAGSLDDIQGSMEVSEAGYQPLPAAHLTHDLHEDGDTGHIVGPVLRPVQW